MEKCNNENPFQYDEEEKVNHKKKELSKDSNTGLSNGSYKRDEPKIPNLVQSDSHQLTKFRNLLAGPDLTSYPMAH